VVTCQLQIERGTESSPVKDWRSTMFHYAPA